MCFLFIIFEIAKFLYQMVNTHGKGIYVQYRIPFKTLAQIISTYYTATCRCYVLDFTNCRVVLLLAGFVVSECEFVVFVKLNIIFQANVPVLAVLNDCTYLIHLVIHQYLIIRQFIRHAQQMELTNKQISTVSKTCSNSSLQDVSSNLNANVCNELKQ